MRHKKVLVTSRSFASLENTPRDILEQAGFEVVSIGKSFNQEAFENLLPEFDALIIGAHPLPGPLLEKCPKLRIVCKHGVGLDNIPQETARQLGIVVTNTPGTNSEAVADLAFGLMLCSARRIVYSVNQVKLGIRSQATGVDVCGKTLGLLGFGRIAQGVARRAAGFGMKVLAYDPYLAALPKGFEHVRLCGLDETIHSCDFLSLHLPLTDETRNMIDAKAIAGMKKGTHIINTARGGIVNEADLYKAIVSGQIMGAALDVVEQEPISASHPLLGLDEVIITNHIGMYSREAITAVSMLCADAVVDFFNGREVHNRVV